MIELDAAFPKACKIRPADVFAIFRFAQNSLYFGRIARRAGFLVALKGEKGQGIRLIRYPLRIVIMVVTLFL